MRADKSDLRLAWSVAPEFLGRRDVVLSWFCLSRVRPNLDPAKAVRGFAGLGHFRQQVLTRYLAELLTREETEVLGRRLAEQYGLELSSRRTVLPLDPGVGLFGLIPASFSIGLYTLPATLVNGKPFDVCAYYDLGFTAEQLPAVRWMH